MSIAERTDAGIATLDDRIRCLNRGYYYIHHAPSMPGIMGYARALHAVWQDYIGWYELDIDTALTPKREGCMYHLLYCFADNGLESAFESVIAVMRAAARHNGALDLQWILAKVEALAQIAKQRRYKGGKHGANRST